MPFRFSTAVEVLATRATVTTLSAKITMTIWLMTGHLIKLYDSMSFPAKKAIVMVFKVAQEGLRLSTVIEHFPTPERPLDRLKSIPP